MDGWVDEMVDGMVDGRGWDRGMGIFRSEGRARCTVSYLDGSERVMVIHDDAF
jgi:hypothetical protein